MEVMTTMSVLRLMCPVCWGKRRGMELTHTNCTRQTLVVQPNRPIKAKNLDHQLLSSVCVWLRSQNWLFLAYVPPTHRRAAASEWQMVATADTMLIVSFMKRRATCTTVRERPAGIPELQPPNVVFCRESPHRPGDIFYTTDASNNLAYCPRRTLQHSYNITLFT